jgi:pimeloyl-ACP methyl ester carboxylesterase
LRKAEEIRLDTRSGNVALLHWKSERPDAPKVLCLHGWLDNAASFLPLAQQLGELDLYALDFPGHGHSDHRNPGVRYAFTEYLFDLDAVLDALEWDRAHLLGHSLGGGVGCTYAAAAPERVRRIAIADGLGPVGNDETKTAAQLRRSLEWLRRPRRPLRRFESLEVMAQAREEGFLTISSEAARIICERASRLEHDEEGDYLVWRTDPALRWNSPLMLSETQILNCLAEIEAPVLSFHAQPWSSTEGARWISKRQAAVRNGTFRDVEGNHHFHMDEAAQIAPEITAFFMEGS